jgi:hypothetical protein
MEVGPDGRIPPAVAAELNARCPLLDVSRIEPPHDKETMYGLFTVEVIVEFVRQAIAMRELKKSA